MNFEYGAAFFHHQAQCPHRTDEVNVVRLVANAADWFGCDPWHRRVLASIESFEGALATERLHDGQRGNPALSRPLTRRWTADRCPIADWNLQCRADLRLRDQRAGFVRCKRGYCVGQQNDAGECNVERDLAHL